jgi:hypothetical protein
MSMEAVKNFYQYNFLEQGFYLETNSRSDRKKFLAFVGPEGSSLRAQRLSANPYYRLKVLYYMYVRYRKPRLRP